MSKLIIILSTILSTVLMQGNTNQTQTTDLTIEQLCSNRTFNMKIENGFRVGTYICLIGSLNLTSVDSFGPRNVIRFTPSLSDNYLFREPWIWNEFKYATEKGVDYIFTSNYLSPLFVNQTANEVLFYVRNRRIASAFQIDYSIEYSSNSTIHVPTFTIGKHKKVLGPSIDYDYSGEVSLNFLINHFPNDSERFIRSVMLYNRDIGEDGFPRVFALVYTRHVFGGQTLYLRHYMKSIRHKVTDHRGPQFDTHYLSWDFDYGNRFCETVDTMPTSVVHLRNDETQVASGRLFTRQFSVKYLELYPLYHRLNHLLFPSDRNDTFVSETLEDNIPNTFICATPPTGSRSIPGAVPCAGCIREIVWVEDKARWVHIFESKQYSRNSTFSIVLIVLTVISIFVVSIIGIILILKRIYRKPTTNTNK